MVRTIKVARKEEKSVAPSRKHSARLGMLRRNTAGFTPMIAKAVTNQEEDSGEESEELPILREVLQKKRGGGPEVVEEAASSDPIDGADSAGDDDEEKGDADDEEIWEQDEADEEADDDGDDEVQSGGDEGSRHLSEGEDQEAVEVEDHVDGDNASSNIEGTDLAEPVDNAVKRRPKKGKRAIPAWDEPKDTQCMLDLLEQLAMRDYYINPKKGSWRNNAFAIVGEQMGKKTKLCSNRYTKLKYKYLEVMKLLNLGVGLSWDSGSNEVYGSDKAWSKVKDPTLVKTRGRKFLYKEEFNNLDSVLNFVSSPSTSTGNGNSGVASKMAVAHQSEDEDNDESVKDDQHDEDGNVEADVAEDRDEEQRVAVQNDVEPVISSVSALDPIHNRTSAIAKPLFANKKHSDKNWFDSASIEELVRLLLEYVQDDYYINPTYKTWQNGVFAQIALAIGKDQKLCQSKWMTLKDTYADIDKLLKSNLGFRWDASENEVVGSNEAWTQVKDLSLTRRRRSKFLFMDEFAKLAEKLDMGRRMNSRTSKQKSRTSTRTSGGRPTYVEPPDEVEQSVDGEGHAESDIPEQAPIPPPKKRLYSDTYKKRRSVEAVGGGEGDAADEGVEPPRKKRLLSDTYEKRREAFYVAATAMCAKREELEAIVQAQLALHREQIAALHAQLTVENKLSKSLEECHLKDALHRDTLEGLRSTAHSRLQHEACLTPLGKLTIMRTLPDLRSKAVGYLNVMFLDPMIRKLWLKVELGKLAAGEPSEYFIDEDSGLTLIDDDFDCELEGTFSDKGACENDDSGVGVHFRGDGCSSGPVEIKHASPDEELQGEPLIRNVEGCNGANPFDIGPYISVEGRQDKDVEVEVEMKAGREEAAGASAPSKQEVEGGSVGVNGDSLTDDALLQEWLNEGAFDLD